MGKAPWTKGDQQQFLESHKESFLVHQKRHTLPKFIRPLFQEWVDRYGIPEPTAEEIEEAGGDAEVAAEVKRLRVRKVSIRKSSGNVDSPDRRMQRVYEWFFNHTPKRPKGSASSLLKELTARTRTMHEEQAYLHLLSKKLMPIIDAAYEEHKANTPKPLRKGPFKFRNDEVKKMYEAESDEVKALVEKFRAGELGANDAAFEDLDDEDEDIQILHEKLEEDEAKQAKERLK